MTRLPVQAGEAIERTRTVHFTFDGRPVSGFEGDTVGSALYAAGQRTFSRSFKYHRRRGLLCCAGACPNCIVAVDGAPGARACVEPVREGMRVEHLNARPGLEFDVMRATDLVGGPFTPPGFYYKTFIRPAPAVAALREGAAPRRGPREAPPPPARARVAYRVPPPARRRAGRRRRRRRPARGDRGGRARRRCGAGRRRPRLRGACALCRRRRRRTRLVSDARVGRSGAPRPARARSAISTEWFPSGRATPCTRSGPASRVYATGTIEQPLVFAGNDLPGVMLADGARRLTALYAVAPGRRAVVATVSDRGLDAALALHRAGVTVLAVADLRHRGPATAPRASSPRPGSGSCPAQPCSRRRAARRSHGS